MNINHLVYIINVAETGSITKAAEKLFISQSALSMAISSFEKEIKIKIFERNRNGVSVTQEGKEIIQRIYPILEKFQDLTSYLNILNGNIPTKLKIKTSTLGRLDAPFYEILAQIKEQFPTIDITVEHGEHDTNQLIGNRRIKELLTDYHFVFRGYYSNQYMQQLELCKGNEINCDLIWKSQFAFYARANHPIFSQSSISKEILKKYRIQVFQEAGHALSTFFPDFNIEILPNFSPYIKKNIIATDKILLCTDLFFEGDDYINSGLQKISTPIPSLEFPNLYIILMYDPIRLQNSSSALFLTLLKNILHKNFSKEITHNLKNSF